MAEAHTAPRAAAVALAYGEEPGRVIPPALYVAVAEVLAHLARLDRVKLPVPGLKGPR